MAYLAKILISFALVTLSLAQREIRCNDDEDCRIHCPLTHQGQCHSQRCTCQTQPSYRCNDENDCRIHCPVTHSGSCQNAICSCDPLSDSFFCNDDQDCRVHCPVTHDGKCQKEKSDNQTCTCNFNPTIGCSTNTQCQLHCPVTHRGSCKSNHVCACDPIPSWLLPTTQSPATTTTANRPSYTCLNHIDCEVHCPTSHKGNCMTDATCACDPHVSGKPIHCQSTLDCIKHCLSTHVGTCESSKTCRCLLQSEDIIG